MDSACAVYCVVYALRPAGKQHPTMVDVAPSNVVDAHQTNKAQATLPHVRRCCAVSLKQDDHLVTAAQQAELLQSNLLWQARSV